MTVTFELPDEIAIADELSTGHKRTVFDLARELRSVPGETMTLEEIQTEVDEVRAKREDTPRPS
jgi:hypothetical protein